MRTLEPAMHKLDVAFGWLVLVTVWRLVCLDWRHQCCWAFGEAFFKVGLHQFYSFKCVNRTQGEHFWICKKAWFIKAFWDFRESRVKSDKLPRVILLEATTVWNENIWKCRVFVCLFCVKDVNLPDFCSSLLSAYSYSVSVVEGWLELWVTYSR